MTIEYQMIEHALQRREELLAQWRHEKTNFFRAFHGATEGISGLSIDCYGALILIQTWRSELITERDVERIVALLSEWLGQEMIGVWNERHRRGQVDFANSPVLSNAYTGLECGLSYDVRLRHEGIDPLLFLDFRAARRWVSQNSHNKRVLNLFAYTCGIGVAALAGGAKSVLNVDFAERSLAVGMQNAQLNQLNMKRFSCLQEDVFPVIRQLSGLGVKGRAARRPFKRLKPQQFDLVILDPPRLAKSPFGKVDLVNDYAALFKPVALTVAEGGCALVTNNVASVDESDWHEQLERCAQKAGRPFANLKPLRPEEDFPSPDGRWPLKMAILEW